MSTDTAYDTELAALETFMTRWWRRPTNAVGTWSSGYDPDLPGPKLPRWYAIADHVGERVVSKTVCTTCHRALLSVIEVPEVRITITAEVAVDGHRHGLVVHPGGLVALYQAAAGEGDLTQQIEMSKHLRSAGRKQASRMPAGLVPAGWWLSDQPADHAVNAWCIRCVRSVTTTPPVATL
jgi:hypothetical protein